MLNSITTFQVQSICNYLININIIAAVVFLILHLTKSRFVSPNIIRKSAALNIQIFTIAAVLALILELVITYTTYYSSGVDKSDYEFNTFLHNERLFGKYWYGYWGYSLFYLLVVLLLLIKPIRQSYIFSLLIMFLSQSVFLFQRFIIIVTSSHRDYIQSSWTMYFNLKEYLLLTVLPGLMFSFLLLFIIKKKYDISRDNI